MSDDLTTLIKTSKALRATLRELEGQLLGLTAKEIYQLPLNLSLDSARAILGHTDNQMKVVQKMIGAS